MKATEAIIIGITAGMKVSDKVREFIMKGTGKTREETKAMAGARINQEAIGNSGKAMTGPTVTRVRIIPTIINIRAAIPGTNPAVQAIPGDREAIVTARLLAGTRVMAQIGQMKEDNRTSKTKNRNGGIAR